jgi:hypothetical protein
MRIRPVVLNDAIAWLFMIGSACFVLGSFPPYLNAVGEAVDAMTYFVGSIFFTSASFLQLLQSQSPETTEVDERAQHERAEVRLLGWRLRDLNWWAAASQFPGTVFFNVSTFAATAHNATAADVDRNVWRPDVYGSTLFLVASTFGILAVAPRFLSVDWRSFPWRIAWLNMVGSIFFMASAIGSYVIPDSDELLNAPISVWGTLLGAVCFLVGAWLMLPAWRLAVARESGGSGEPLLS